MLKKLLRHALRPEETPAARTNGSAANGAGAAGPTTVDGSETSGAAYAPFDEVYRNTPEKACKMTYSILKIAEMLASPHLSGMPPGTKRASLMMALEAAGISVDDLLQDAMSRQRALNEYEASQEKRLKKFETAKLEENRRIQADLDRITAQHLARIQANLDEITQQQEQFQVWQRDKQEESQRISEAAAICVPQSAPSSSEDSISLVVERVMGPRRLAG